MTEVQECTSCGNRVILSGGKTCPSCGMDTTDKNAIEKKQKRNEIWDQFANGYRSGTKFSILTNQIHEMGYDKDLVADVADEMRQYQKQRLFEAAMKPGIAGVLALVLGTSVTAASLMGATEGGRISIVAYGAIVAGLVTVIFSVARYAKAKRVLG